MARLLQVTRPAAIALLATTGFAALPATARAGECPADRVVADSNRAVETQPRGVTDDVLASVDLAKEPAAVQNRLLRLRRLVVQPGGVVPWHSHGMRPAIIYIVEGEITEYASTCAVPIDHRAGEATVERNPTQHWWRNNGSRPAVLLSADFFPVADDPHMM
ncbi:cupin domain-containing protein [Falsiroseomonas sp. HW251]|uniref:cupin domain-containing protein n=1 Tax=Falsiroseomonas sp. HW251 TaxID=3390998 RepID=UPI003D3215D9